MEHRDMVISKQLLDKMEITDQKIIWSPLPGSQSLAMSCPCNRILYEGTRGPGKTDAQLMFFRKYVGLGYGQFWRGIIFDREYKNLDDIIAKSKKWFPQFGDGARFISGASNYKWQWPTGEELLFRSIKRPGDYWAYHGQEYPFIGWNELTKYPTPMLYDDMMSCNRTSFLPQKHSPMDPVTGSKVILPEIPLVVFATSNPFGAGHSWVKERFIDAGEPGQIVKTNFKVFNPRTQTTEVVTTTQTRIFGSYKENSYLTPEYVATLHAIGNMDQKRAWLTGDWDISVGGAFDGAWGQHNIISRFKIPSRLRVDRSFDWGNTRPFSVGWWAMADGEEIDITDAEGKESSICPPSGTLIRISEWYGAKKIGLDIGLKMPPSEIAKGIKMHEKFLMENGWIEELPKAGPADSSIFNQDIAGQDSIADSMTDNGVSWTTADKRQGSRIIGLNLARQRMIASRTKDGPGLLIMNNCTAAIKLVPTLPLDDLRVEDIDTDCEDHIWDEIRYRVLASSNRMAENLNIEMAY